MVAISSMVYKASAIENFATEEVRKVVIKAHRRILEAIVAKDADAARAADGAPSRGADRGRCKAFPTRAVCVIEMS